MYDIMIEQKTTTLKETYFVVSTVFSLCMYVRTIFRLNGAVNGLSPDESRNSQRIWDPLSLLFSLLSRNK